MKTLSPKQQQIYDYIISFSAEHGYPPSVREIGAYVGLKSPSTVHFHLKGLEAAGLITKDKGKTRAITVCPEQGEALPGPGQVPIVGNVAAGAPILAQECIEDYLTFDTGGRTGEHFALRVRGGSLWDAGALPRARAGASMGGACAPHHDLVVGHRLPDAHRGEIVVALFEDEATVKTLRRKDGHIWLMPENPEYEPIDGDGCSILGKVVAVVRRY